MHDFRKLTNGGVLWVSPDATALASRLALNSISDVVADPPGEKLTAAAHRAVHRIKSPGGEIYFLKLSRPRRKSLGWLRSFLFPRSTVARTEAENAWALIAAGVDVASPVAVGELVEHGQETASFLLTNKANGTELMSLLYCGERLTDEDLSALCVLLDSLFQAGLYPLDLVPKHLYLSRDEHGSHWCLIDMFRMKRGRPNHTPLMDEVLARLSSQSPQFAVPQSQRLRLLRMLLGERSRGAWRRIAKSPIAQRSRRRLRGFLRTSSAFREEHPMALTDDGVWLAKSLHEENGRLSDEGVPVMRRRSNFSASLRNERAQIEEQVGRASAVRTLLNVSSTLSEFLTVPMVMAAVHEPMDDGEGWVVTLAAGERGCPDPLFSSGRLATQLSQVVSVMLRTKIFPQGKLFDWTTWNGDELVLAPALDVGSWSDFSDSGQQRLRAQIAQELSDAGWDAGQSHELDRQLEFSWPRYLGPPVSLFGDNLENAK